METIDLSSADYWESEESDIRLNPAAKLDQSGLREAMQDRGIHSSIVLATSGTAGKSKLIVLEKSAMLCSARAVNQWCGITKADTWLGGLSTFHVGGLSIFCRAFLTGSRVNVMAWNEWSRDGTAFLDAVKDATVTSLTPVHLYDLVTAEVTCPERLRGVFIGGGALSVELAAAARDLRWPLWTTYGMTEACSQIATSLDGDPEWLPILPHWEAGLSNEGHFMIKGGALMSGYFTRKDDGKWEWNEAADQNGFYTTGDLVELCDGKLRPLGRADDQVKILGELVSLTKLETSLSRNLGVPAVVLARPDERRGAILTAVIESEIDLMDRYMNWNSSLPPFEQMGEVKFQARFPRTGVGKIDRQALIQLHHR